MGVGLPWLQVSGPTIGRVIDVENMHVRKVSVASRLTQCPHLEHSLGPMPQRDWGTLFSHLYKLHELVIS